MRLELKIFSLVTAILSVSGSFFSSGASSALFDAKRSYQNEVTMEVGSDPDASTRTGTLFTEEEEMTQCYGDIASTVFSDSQNNNFLDMVNFMEFVQQNSIEEESAEEARNFYDVAVAAMRAGNTFVAQENMARALTTTQMSGGRGKRQADDETNAGDLFEKFKEDLGTDGFQDLLHFKKKVSIAFIIDTSSSMANDMDQVRAHIGKIVQEQEAAGVAAFYVVTTFADPKTERSAFYNKNDLMEHLENLETSDGGDCEEQTCLGIYYALRERQLFRIRNTIAFVFTDADSKDCSRLRRTIKSYFDALRGSIFFILFDSCKPTIDVNYVKLASDTKGFTLLVKRNGIYNITDTVNGAFENDALIMGEESDNARTVLGQGHDETRRKRTAEDQDRELVKSILIDTSMQRYKLVVTAAPSSLLEQVRLETPLDGDPAVCSAYDATRGTGNVLIASSYADNTVIFDVSVKGCPCIGEWKLVYPAETKTFSYSVKTSGEYIVSFESYFMDEGASGTNANVRVKSSGYTPCLGIEENLIIKLNQGSKVNIDSLQVKIVGLAGSKTHWESRLAEYQIVMQNGYKENAFLIPFSVPRDMGTEGFRVQVEGNLIDGSRFQRISRDVFEPTSSCLRVNSVRNYYSLSPRTKTFVSLAVANNNPYPDTYTVTCSNSENYDINVGVPRVIGPGGFNKIIASNPVELKPAQTGYFVVGITSPHRLSRGRTVTVICKAESSTEELLEMLRLTEMDTSFGSSTSNYAFESIVAPGSVKSKSKSRNRSKNRGRN